MKMRLIIKSIENVQPYKMDASNDPVRCDSELTAPYTGIECKMQILGIDGNIDEDIVLLLPRGKNGEGCKNTYLLCDAMREE